MFSAREGEDRNRLPISSSVCRKMARRSGLSKSVVESKANHDLFHAELQNRACPLLIFLISPMMHGGFLHFILFRLYVIVLRSHVGDILMNVP